jgi:hypothetical protein
MDQTEARQRAELYNDHGIAAIARTPGGWANAVPEKPWHVALKARDKEYYYEYDVRVSLEFNRLRDALKKEREEV